MLLTPRYDGPTVLRVECPLVDLRLPLLRQRRRLAQILATLDADQWQHGSRCEHWSVQDVVAHLIRTNQVWQLAFSAALAGKPTRMMQGFDPVTTPSLMVEAMRALTPAQVLASFVETTEELASAVAGAGEAGRSLVGESPLGHVGLDAVILHALWDAWIHERDILLPLGLAPVEEPDEVTACLYYAAAVGPALQATTGHTRRGVLAVEATGPEVQFMVETGSSVVVWQGPARPATPRLTGPAVDLVEGLSFRAPLPAQLTGEDQWLVTGLATAFDRTG